VSNNSLGSLTVWSGGDKMRLALGSSEIGSGMTLFKEDGTLDSTVGVAYGKKPAKAKKGKRGKT